MPSSSEVEWPSLEHARQGFELIASGELALPVFEDLGGDDSGDDSQPLETHSWEDAPRPEWGQGWDFHTDGSVGRFTLELEVDGILSGWGSRALSKDADGAWIWEVRGPTCNRGMFQVLPSTYCACGDSMPDYVYCRDADPMTPRELERWRKDVAYLLAYFQVEWDPTITL